jgi:hypothetical protein
VYRPFVFRYTYYTPNRRTCQPLLSTILGTIGIYFRRRLFNFYILYNILSHGIISYIIYYILFRTIIFYIIYYIFLGIIYNIIYYILF